MRTRTLATIALSTGLLGGALVGCSSDDIVEGVANDALEDSGAEVSLGDVPSDFPSEVPLPEDGVDLETAVGAAGNFTFRYTITDPKAASDAYKAKVEAAGFTVSDEFDNLATEGGNYGFIATGSGYSINVAAFGPPSETIPDGNYMGVVVLPG